MISEKDKNSTAKRAPAPHRPTTSAGPAAPGLLGLQGTAGNAAVVQMLRQGGHPWAGERHEHGDGCGHQPQTPLVQRSTAHDVLRGPGRPMDDVTRSEMESRLGADFSDVRLHTDSVAQRSAAELGARAYTSGSHVVIGQGGADKHTLAHELTHVIQQRQGAVAGTDNGAGLRVSDPSDRFERAAEANAQAVMGRPVPAPAADVQRAAAPDARSTPGLAVQRAVVLGTRIYSNAHPQAYEKDPEPLWKQLETWVQNEPAPRRSEFRTHEPALKKQLNKWVDDQGAGEKNTPGGSNNHHPLYGRKVRNHSFPDVEQLYQSLLGWVVQKPGRHREKELAQEVKGNDEIEVHLDILLARVSRWITELGLRPMDPAKHQQIVHELQTGLVNQQEYGTYRTHFDIKAAARNPAVKTGINGNMLAVLQHPEKYSMRDKVVVLHDVMEYFLAARHGAATAGSGLLAPPTPDQKRGTSKVDFFGNRIATVASKGMHVDRNAGFITRDEKDPTTRLARDYKVPVWVGQSETTARMMNFGAAAGGDAMELGAAAWALFSFWRLDYDHTVTWGYHTLHEVLDIANNFGVPYNLLHPEAGLRNYRPGGLLDNLRGWQLHLEDEVDKLGNAVADYDKHAAAAGLTPLAGHLARLERLVTDLARVSADVHTAEQAGRREDRQGALREFTLLCQPAIRLYQGICDALRTAPPPPARTGTPTVA
ncbi:eCIS core domain-containing protein [Streptomyces vinaceus]|uniref:eCIS core domain-containing protein n=1 Tax=Streptomyces vinaceus TaxID=1960 RepID=UPI0036B0BB37